MPAASGRLPPTMPYPPMKRRSRLNMCIEPPRPPETPSRLPNSSAITYFGSVPRASAWPCDRQGEIREPVSRIARTAPTIAASSPIARCRKPPTLFLAYIAPARSSKRRIRSIASSHSRLSSGTMGGYVPTLKRRGNARVMTCRGMRALVYGGAGQRSWDNVDDPGIQDPTDVIVKVDATTICGTDLHILKGDVPAVTEGRVLGHEAVGTVVETGAAVSSLSEGDRVLVPAITSCGRCGPCKRGMAAHCEAVGGVGWMFGHLIDGVQSEFARVPYAETSVHVIPEGVSDEQVLFLADILPTGYEIGGRNGGVGPGDPIAVVGAGPVGLAAMMTAAIAGASRIIAVDLADSRLRHAEGFGATHTVRAGDDAEAKIAEITGGEGVDVAMEAVGIPATFDLCTRIVKAGGTVANIGVHGAPTTLHLEDLWIKNITITTGLVSGSTVPTLLSLVRDGKIQADLLGTHT